MRVIFNIDINIVIKAVKNNTFPTFSLYFSTLLYAPFQISTVLKQTKPETGLLSHEHKHTLETSDKVRSPGFVKTL